MLAHFNAHCLNTAPCLTSVRLLSFITFLQTSWPCLQVPDLSRNWGSSITAVWRRETSELPLRQVSNNFFTPMFGVWCLMSCCWDITTTVSCPSVSQQQQTLCLKVSVMQHHDGLISTLYVLNITVTFRYFILILTHLFIYLLIYSLS